MLQNSGALVKIYGSDQTPEQCIVNTAYLILIVIILTRGLVLFCIPTVLISKDALKHET